MMSKVDADTPSAKEKALTVVTGVGVFWLSWGALGFLYALLPLNPLAFLWVQAGEISVLSPHSSLAYLAVLAAAMFVGWSLRDKAWLYGGATGVSTQLPGVGASFITMSRLSFDLSRSSDMVLAGPGTPPAGVPQLWLVTVLIPLLAGVGLGALGALCGGRVRDRGRGDRASSS